MSAGSKKIGFLIGVAFFIALFAWGAWIRPDDSGEPETVNWKSPLLVEARGYRRGWQFTYSGADGELGTDDDVQTKRQLYLPVGVATKIQLRSDDYAYVFSCPDLKLKEIAVPELEFGLEFEVTETGKHELEMDPLCGFRLPKGQSMGQLIVLPSDDFTKWLNRTKSKVENE